MITEYELKERFKHVHFIDETHTYYVNGNRVPSVSSVIGKYKPKFDKEYWLPRKAKELGVTEVELEAVWNLKRDTAIEKGKNTHNFIEATLRDEEWTKPPIELVNRYLASITDTTIACELIMGNELLCGTTDNLALRNGKLVLKDWKTNWQFREDSQYKMLPPFQYIPNTEYYIYAIQLNLYRKLLGLEVDTLEIVWFNNDTWRIYNMPIMEREMRIIFQDLQNNQK